MELTEHPDWALVTRLGGPVKVASLLGWQKDGGAQRVQNWKYRGIPPAVKLARPDLFLPNLRQAGTRRTPTNHPHQRATDRPSGGCPRP